MYTYIEIIWGGSPVLRRENALAQKKKTATKGGKKNTKKAVKKPTQPKLSAAEKRAQKEAAIQEATVMQRVGSEVLGVVLIALGILLGLYLYRTTDAPLGVALQKVLFGAVGVVAFGLPPFLVLLGVFSIAGRKRMPVSKIEPSRSGRAQPFRGKCVSVSTTRVSSSTAEP